MSNPSGFVPTLPQRPGDRSLLRVLGGTGNSFGSLEFSQAGPSRGARVILGVWPCAVRNYGSVCPNHYRPRLVPRRGLRGARLERTVVTSKDQAHGQRSPKKIRHETRPGLSLASTSGW